MKLLVAEKPSVAEAIAAVIGLKKKEKGYFECGEYIVTWCVGHLVRLATPQEYDDKYRRWSFDTLPIIPSAFHMKIDEEKKERFFTIRKLMNDDRTDEIRTLNESTTNRRRTNSRLLATAQRHKPQVW